MTNDPKPTRASAFRGVIFDMDGVLCDSERFICEAAIRMFAECYQRTVAPEDFVPFVGMGENRYLGGVAEKHGIPLDIDLAKRRTYALYLNLIRGRLQPLPGALEFIPRCRHAGLLLAVASSADRVKLFGNLKEIGLPPATFDATVNGLEVTRKKPAPDIFLLAAERIGVSAGECLVVEDAPSGLRAGKAAGARCLGLTTSFPAPTLREAGADWVGRDLADVPPDLVAGLRLSAA